MAQRNGLVLNAILVRNKRPVFINWMSGGLGQYRVAYRKIASWDPPEVGEKQCREREREERKRKSPC